jgi:hypothetical protein
VYTLINSERGTHSERNRRLDTTKLCGEGSVVDTTLGNEEGRSDPKTTRTLDAMPGVVAKFVGAFRTYKLALLRGLVVVHPSHAFSGENTAAGEGVTRVGRG